KLINTNNPSQLFGHLFWELGDLGANVTGDTLRIVMLRPSLGVSQVVLTACKAVTVDMPSFGLGDQTFVRNTGDFTNAFVGEGGTIAASFARVFAYSAKDSLRTRADSCNMAPAPTLIPEAGTDDQDFGMSPGTHVSDFISNTGVHVVAVATNFNGLTNLVRAGTDSIYYLDQGLRLSGTSSVGAGTPGMDMNYNHAFDPGAGCTPPPTGTCGGGSGNLGERMVFAASPDTSIVAFDTYFFNQQKSIKIRDPIIGPLRVAKDSVAGQPATQLLFGITARRSEEHTSELQSLAYLVCRLLLEKKKQPQICRHDLHAVPPSVPAAYSEDVAKPPWARPLAAPAAPACPLEPQCSNPSTA